MLADKRILALIPARGGSQRLPGKNIKKLLGRPLITWTIRQARKSAYIDTIIVSTDDKEIAAVASRSGAYVPFLRPKTLAQSTSPTIDVIEHALSWFGARKDFYDILVLLEPTSPLRKDDDIDKAIALFAQNSGKADSLVSLGEVHLEKPAILKTIRGRYVRPYIPVKKTGRRGNGEAYFPYGVIYLSTVKALKEYRTFYQKKTIPYFIERWQNYEIDDIFDFVCIEAILKLRKGAART